ncbi:MAG: hypothetical protein A2106_02180 [Planctomycetes bacterium GWF2_40_8]|nr:MAG: hypothetical protein A2106_02180 [Planctomycetes bacterium GWF2_40_8]OHC03081.1 MAG: hypothetical protein A3H23_03860 [Planctomycetes bacterium RIFCSPLOWO2_12_FULL_40_19]
MGKIEKFEDIEAWKMARKLVKEIYFVCKVESYNKDYNLIDQTRRTAISIMANIAEGFARRTNKEFTNFLGIAHASAAELQSHLYVALDQDYILSKLSDFVLDTVVAAGFLPE